MEFCSSQAESFVKKRERVKQTVFQAEKIKKTQSSDGYFFHLPPIIYIPVIEGFLENIVHISHVSTDETQRDRHI